MEFKTHSLGLWMVFNLLGGPNLTFQQITDNKDVLSVLATDIVLATQILSGTLRTLSASWEVDKSTGLSTFGIRHQRSASRGGLKGIYDVSMKDKMVSLLRPWFLCLSGRKVGRNLDHYADSTTSLYTKIVKRGCTWGVCKFWFVSCPSDQYLRKYYSVSSCNTVDYRLWTLLLTYVYYRILYNIGYSYILFVKFTIKLFWNASISCYP